MRGLISILGVALSCGSPRPMVPLDEPFLATPTERRPVDDEPRLDCRKNNCRCEGVCDPIGGGGIGCDLCLEWCSAVVNCACGDTLACVQADAYFGVETIVGVPYDGSRQPSESQAIIEAWTGSSLEEARAAYRCARPEPKSYELDGGGDYQVFFGWAVPARELCACGLASVCRRLEEGAILAPIEEILGERRTVLHCMDGSTR